MRALPLATIGALVVLALAACSGSAATNRPSTAASASVVASATAGAPASAAESSAAACTDSSDAATVDVSIIDFAFSPEAVEAAVGDVIGWTNNDSSTHSAVVDDGGCGTENLANGQSGGLVFSEPGTYPYVCGIHAQMRGTIEISG